MMTGVNKRDLSRTWGGVGHLPAGHSSCPIRPVTGLDQGGSKVAWARRLTQAGQSQVPPLLFDM